MDGNSGGGGRAVDSARGGWLAGTGAVLEGWGSERIAGCSGGTGGAPELALQPGGGGSVAAMARDVECGINDNGGVWWRPGLAFWGLGTGASLDPTVCSAGEAQMSSRGVKSPIADYTVVPL